MLGQHSSGDLPRADRLRPKPPLYSALVPSFSMVRGERAWTPSPDAAFVPF